MARWSIPALLVVMGLGMALSPACARPEPPAVAVPATDGKGRIGIRFQPLPEGLLVLEVAPGTGAALAGIAVGDLILAADGQALAGLDEPASRLTGPPGSTVSLRLAGPLGAPERSAAVQRGLPAQPEAAPPLAPSLAAYTAAAETGDKAEILAAAEALVADRYAGLAPGVALAPGLLRLNRRAPKLALDLARRLATEPDLDGPARSALARVLVAQGEGPEALAALTAAVAARPPDLVLPDGRVVDLGGDGALRGMQAERLHASGDVAGGLAQARRLLALRDLPPLSFKLGVAPRLPGEAWVAQVPPLTPLPVQMLGAEPRLLEADGTVRVLAFWATWCGPCRKELPEIAELAAARAGAPLEVLAISVDTTSEAAIQAGAEELGITDLSLGHDLELSRRMGVQGIPAIRVLGKEGGLHYAARGYGADSTRRLAAAVDAALKAEAGGGAPIARARGPLRLLDFSPVAGALGLAAGTDDRFAVGAKGTLPLVHRLGQADPADPEIGSSPAQRLAWLDGGPVAGDRDRPLLRAFDAEGGARWLRTLPAALRDLDAGAEGLWVATEGGPTLLLGPAGDPLAQAALPLRDVAADPAGGAWGVDGRRRWHLRVDGATLVAEDRGPAPGSAQVAGDGSWAGGVVEELVMGRFGPDGALRTVLSRDDASVLALDENGQLVGDLSLRGPPAIAVLRRPDEARDLLLVGVVDQGVAVVALELP